MEILFDRFWKMEDKNNKNQQQFWDLRADEFNSRMGSQRTMKEVEEVLKYLKDKGAIDEKGKVLDIGCGPGKYTLAFAKEVICVIGTDISSKMISFAKENARSRGLTNVNFFQASWPEVNIEELGWKKNFDLVFAAFCPGIDGPDALKKMVEASSKHCFLSGFVSRQDQVLEGLKKHLGIQGKTWGNQVYYSFNLLWQWGYYPEITYQDRAWTNEYDVQQMADILVSRLDGQASKEDIMDYLKTVSVNGKVKEHSRSKIAWLYWQV
ncbi:MAG TPA: methyltransferase domain-containing protein [Tepidanaerobacteraceae bacterium]|nr:methyltransferase domain-containing protein [Tepidanaerobacteraceae bacterium]